MHKKHYLPIAAASIAVFLIVVISSLNSYLYNMKYYERLYGRTGVYDRFPEDEARTATQNIMDFFRGRGELDTVFFSQDEISHLLDVRNLISSCQLVFYLGLTLFWLIVIFMYLVDKRHFLDFFSVSIISGGIAAFCLVLLLGLLYLFSGFDSVFLRFHELFFTGNYSFDPAVSNMKALFPDRFFQEFALTLARVTLLKSGALIVAGYLIKKR